MAQSRKKAILAEVQKQRRRNRLISLAAIVLIVVVAVAVFIALPRSGNSVSLPDYLNGCVASVVYHAHPHVSLVINGSGYTIPASVGIQGACNKPIHTHDAGGTLHVETGDNRDYKLQDFFLIWGNYESNPTLAIFNSTQVFGGHTGNGHTLTLTVNGISDSSFQNYVIPRNANSGSETCSATPCQNTAIVITYT